jgi:hypothetical protein
MEALLTWAMPLMMATTDDSLAPRALNHHPADVSNQHVEEIADGRVEYDVVQ